MSMAARIEKMTPGSHYAGLTDASKAGPVWNGRLALAPDHILTQPLRWQKPRRIFVNSMGDLFHEDVPDDWIDRVFAVMALAPQHTFQVLTKRAERMRNYLLRDPDVARDRWYQSVPAGKWPVSIAEAYAAIHPQASDEARAVYLRQQPIWPIPNVWLGVSTEDQRRAEERIPALLDTPAAVRFVSAEPLLGPMDLRVYMPNPLWNDLPSWKQTELDWVIAGGESGPKARPMHPDWARALRDQCQAAGVPFLFKQWGNHAATYDRDQDDPDWQRCRDAERKSPNGQWLNLAGGQGFHGERVVRVNNVGKKAAGRRLDGIEHNGYPEVRS